MDPRNVVVPTLDASGEFVCEEAAMPTKDMYARYFELVRQPKKQPRLDKATTEELLAEVARRRLAERDPLLEVPTCRLVEELALRDGVIVHEVEPQGRGSVSAPGPATLLVVLD